MELVVSHRPSLLWRAIGATCVGISALLSLTSGCQCQKTVTSSAALLENTQSDEDHLSEGMKDLSHTDEEPLSVAYRQVEFHLNEWIRRQDSPAEWARDPMADRIPKDFAPMVSDEFLKQEKFLTPDIRYLDEALTLRNVGKWVVATPSNDPDFTAWLDSARSKIGNNAADDLAAAERLFDWTICNLQLDPLPPPPRAKPAGPDAPNAPATKVLPAPGAAIFPLHAVLFGHGDAWERGRTFIGLCRQQGLLAVVIGFQDESSSWMRPWAVAVVVDGKLYLFDPALGIPIPGEKGQGIVTLEELRAKPELLRQLDSENAPYPVSAADLSGAMALIEVEPLALARRVYQLEKKLTGPNRLALSVSPTAISQKLRQIKSLADVRIWSVPFQAYIFREQIQGNREYIEQMNREWTLVAAPPLGFARRRHLTGRIESKETIGAKRLYMAGRPTESEVEELERNAEMQKALLAPLAGNNPSLLEDPEWRRVNFPIARRQIDDLRLQASYWLGMASFDAREFSAAANHFQLRVLDKFPGSRREWGARYNLARSLEAEGQFEKARKIYLSDDGPQHLGSQLRAKRLEGKKPVMSP